MNLGEQCSSFVVLGVGHLSIVSKNRPVVVTTERLTPQYIRRIMTEPMSPNLKPATFRIDAHLLEGLEEIRRRDGVGVSEQVRRAITAWLQVKGIGEKKAAPRRASTRRKA